MKSLLSCNIKMLFQLKYQKILATSYCFGFWLFGGQLYVRHQDEGRGSSLYSPQKSLRKFMTIEFVEGRLALVLTSCQKLIQNVQGKVLICIGISQSLMLSHR